MKNLEIPSSACFFGGSLYMDSDWEPLVAIGVSFGAPLETN